MTVEPKTANIDDVYNFWENNPLFVGESNSDTGSFDYFEEHRKICIVDCYAGQFDNRMLPEPSNCNKVLDLGCGPGFWTIELQKRSSIINMVSADLTQQAIDLTKKRLEHYNLTAETFKENAENLSFANGSFSHVNCQGVIHHTPNTEQAVSEIARVLEENGTACLSVYYKNIILRNWGFVSWLGKLVSLKGRGREKLADTSDIDEIVRHYDGSENPIGKSYTKQEFIEMLTPYFEVEKIYYHFFPARALPIKIPKFIHRFLDKHLPFMIYVNVRKK